jgi:hypothetical protein
VETLNFDVHPFDRLEKGTTLLLCGKVRLEHRSKSHSNNFVQVPGLPHIVDHESSL